MTSETVFDVLAYRARRRSARFLAVQAGVSACVAAVLWVLAAPWGPFSSLLLAVSCYSLWGVLDSRRDIRRTRSLAFAKHALVMLATLACLATAIGTAFALFVGDSSSPYGVCYDAHGRAFSCNSRGGRR